jgi:hypothetical protein
MTWLQRQCAVLYHPNNEITKNAVFWDVAPCGSCKDRRFGGPSRCHIPEDGVLHTHRNENLKSYNETTSLNIAMNSQWRNLIRDNWVALLLSVSSVHFFLHKYLHRGVAYLALTAFKTISMRKKKLHGLSPRANYTDRATTTSRWSGCQLVRIKGAMWSVWRIPTVVFLVF